MTRPAIHVTGLREIRRDMRRLSPELAAALRDDLKAAGASVVADVVRNVPRRSGASAASVRVTSGGNAVYLRAGGAKAPHFGWLDFGGVLRPSGGRRNTQRRERLAKGRYVYPAIGRNERSIVAAVGRAFDQARRRAQL